MEILFSRELYFCSCTNKFCLLVIFRSVIVWFIMKKSLRTFLVSITLLTSSVFLSGSALAVTYSVEGNGAGSSNNISSNTTNNTTVNQNSNANVSNNVNSNCNTGGNQANNNTGGNTSISTGDCQSNVNITTNVNKNNANISCPTCPKVSPIPTPKGGPGASPSPAVGYPTPSSSNPGPGGGPVSNPTSGANPQVLAGAGVAQDTVAFLAGFLSLTFGLWHVQRLLLKK